MWSRWPNIVMLACILQTSLQAKLELDSASENRFGPEEIFNLNLLDQNLSDVVNLGPENDEEWSDSAMPENRFEDQFVQKRAYPPTPSFIRKLWVECRGTKKSFCHRRFVNPDSTMQTFKKSLWMTRLRRDQDQGNWMTRLRRSGREQDWMARLKKDDVTVGTIKYFKPYTKFWETNKNWMTRMRRSAPATTKEFTADELSDAIV